MSWRRPLCILAMLGAGAITGAACEPAPEPARDPGLGETTDAVGLAPGHSAVLSGMHDGASGPWLRGTTSNPDKGWITDLKYSTDSIDCHTADTSGGVSYIQRIDLDQPHSFPDASTLTQYVNAFASYVTACSQIHVWIVGNEPNVTPYSWNPGTQGDPPPSNYADTYAIAYTQVRARVHGISGHQNDLVLMSPASPFSPNCMCSMHQIIQRIVAHGGPIDGFAIHAYTQATSSSALVGAVTSGTTNHDSCGSFNMSFPIYRDWIAALTAEGQGGKQVFITEAGNVWSASAGQPPCGGSCYPDSNVQYFQAMYQEIRTYNASHTTKVRAVTPYRWTDFGPQDPQSHPFAISARPQLQGDLTAAFAANLQSPLTCDNGVRVGNTACNGQDPGGAFVCTYPGASSTLQWVRVACPSGQTCQGSQCQAAAPPTTCDNNVPLNGTACNHTDEGAQYICTHPGQPSGQQWTRQACPAGQLCGGNRCQPTCDNNVAVGDTACSGADRSAQFVCTFPGQPSGQQWTRQVCPAGQSCLSTHCQ